MRTNGTECARQPVVKRKFSLISGAMKMISKNIIVPKILKSKWITEARLAFVFAPIEASIAVTQVPIFIPSVTKIALRSVIS